jgi:5-methylthioadenosine/S-adenosylhomocysteine deaminase
LERADLLIENCMILSMTSKNPILKGIIAIEDGKIIFIGKPKKTLRIKAEKKIDGKGKLALPGLINAHTHISMTLLRGIAEDKPLNVWLEETIWPLEAKLKPEDIYIGALLGSLEMIKNGITCFADMYFSEEMVAKAVEESGLRAVLSEGIFEAGGKHVGEKMLKKSVAFAKQFNRYAEGRITTLLGPHAAYSCSEELLGKIVEEISNLKVGVHIHLAESKDFEQKYGLSETEFLEKIGIFKNSTLAAHCIYLSKRDMQILSRRKVNAVHVPVSNMKLASGIARIKDLINSSINVCLGTDGPASNNTLDMFETMKIAALLQKIAYMNPTVLPAYDVLKMATINGAKALGLSEKVGTIEVGKRADIVLLDLSKPHLTPLQDIYACIVYSARGSDVDTVIVDGKVLMESRQVMVLNEADVREKAEKTALNLLSR